MATTYPYWVIKIKDEDLYITQTYHRDMLVSSGFTSAWQFSSEEAAEVVALGLEYNDQTEIVKVSS